MHISSILPRLFLVLLAPAVIPALCQAETSRWYKGNTHTHTTLSDGDSTPGLVARWYRNQGYDFLFLTDHNVRTDIDQLQVELDAENKRDGRKPFLLIPGEEVTDTFKGPDRKYSLHTNGLDTRTTVGKQGGSTKQEMLQRSIDAIHKAGGLPQVNHPNFLWSLQPEDLLAMKRLRHFEIYNGHPLVNNLGGGGTPGTEQAWDILLTNDRLMYGVAVDDAHHFKRFARDQSNPGKGWVVVRAPRLDPSSIVQGLREGNFYASTGVELADIVATTSPACSLGITIQSSRDCRYRTEFIGSSGRVLSTDETTAPRYLLPDGEKYVRAKVTSSNGDSAWTQPLFRIPPSSN